MFRALCIVFVLGAAQTLAAYAIAQSSIAQEAGQPLQLGPAPPSENVHFNLNCSKMPVELRPLCELSEALLNRSCESLQDGDQKLQCSLALAGENDDGQYHRLKLICDADWIQTVAKECAVRGARLSPRFKERLASDMKAKVAVRRAQAEAEASAAVGVTYQALATCALNQAERLMATDETAQAVAAASYTLCPTEVQDAARALDYSVDLQLWSDGPQPRPRSSRNFTEEKRVVDALLPKLTASIMEERADVARAAKK
jgi:hypothetical protein